MLRWATFYALENIQEHQKVKVKNVKFCEFKLFKSNVYTLINESDLLVKQNYWPGIYRVKTINNSAITPRWAVALKN